MVEKAKETVKVKLVNGKEREVEIYKFIGFRKKQQIFRNALEGSKTQGDDINLDAGKSMKIFEELAEAVWADKNVKLDDVEGDSLMSVLSERFDRFLGNLGFSAEEKDNPSDKQGEDKES